MEKDEIIKSLVARYGTSNTSDVSELDRWRLYEILKSKVQESIKNPGEYTRQIITISDTLEL